MTRDSAEALIRAFDDAFAALWRRSRLTRGEVTLIAITERVLYTATERFPVLASLEVEASGLSLQELRTQGGLRVDQISEAIRFVLVEFLTVLGNLTAEILTPALHAELSHNLSQFSFFDRRKVDAGEMQFVDLGVILRAKGLKEAGDLIMEQVKTFTPAMVVIDSFKVFDDLARSREEQRTFSYGLAVQLMARETTTILLGEYGPDDMASTPMFSIVDGMIMLALGEQSGEQQRFVQVIKMRGTNHRALSAGGRGPTSALRCLRAPRARGRSGAERTS